MPSWVKSGRQRQDEGYKVSLVGGKSSARVEISQAYVPLCVLLS